VGGLNAGLAAISEKTASLNLGVKEHVALWATVLMTSFGTWGLPQMIHKYYAIRDEKEVKRGMVISTVFALIVAGGGYFIGSLSRLFFNELPIINGKGNADYLVPNMLEQANLPTILVGVVLVLLISASVSTLASITLTASSTLTMDLVQPRILPKMSSEGAARLTKGICGVFVILSYFIANTDTPILDMMSYSWGIISGSFLAPYLLSLYWRRINRAGAWAGMIGGFITAAPPVVCRLFFPDVMLGKIGKIVDMGPHFACAAMVISVLLCVIVSNIGNSCNWKSAQPNPHFYGDDLAAVSME
jgi:SSS family solute:Na+ symporter/sodium/proline symporter